MKANSEVMQDGGLMPSRFINNMVVVSDMTASAKMVMPYRPHPLSGGGGDTRDARIDWIQVVNLGNSKTKPVLTLSLCGQKLYDSVNDKFVDSMDVEFGQQLYVITVSTSKREQNTPFAFVSDAICSSDGGSSGGDTEAQPFDILSDQNVVGPLSVVEDSKCAINYNVAHLPGYETARKVFVLPPVSSVKDGSSINIVGTPPNDPSLGVSGLWSATIRIQADDPTTEYIGSPDCDIVILVNGDTRLIASHATNSWVINLGAAMFATITTSKGMVCTAKEPGVPDNYAAPYYYDPVSGFDFAGDPSTIVQ